MRISIVVPFYPPSIGGVEAIARDTAQELAGRGHDISVITTTHNNTWKKIAEPGIEIVNEVTIHRLKPRLLKIGVVPMMKNLRETLAKISPEIVHSHNLHPHLFQVIKWKKRLDYKVVVQLHCPKVAGIDFKSTRFLYPLVMQYLRLKQHGIDMFFVHTNLERDLLINDGIEERKIHKVTYPCIASKFLERLSFKREHASSFTILYIGRIAYRKGIHILLEALPNIIEYSGDVVALIAGPKEEEYYKKLLQLVDVLNLRKYVILKQALSEQEKYEYMRSCQVFVSPSIRDYTPVTLIEAQAFGKPVVSTRVGAIPEIVNKGHTGLLVAPKNAKELAEAIKWLILNENERRSMGLNARRWVKDNFLLENTINQIERLYINCLNQ